MKSPMPTRTRTPRSVDSRIAEDLDGQGEARPGPAEFHAGRGRGYTIPPGQHGAGLAASRAAASALGEGHGRRRDFTLSAVWKWLDAPAGTLPELRAGRLGLYDDGLNGDAGPLDGTFSAELPLFPPGATIEFFLDATNLVDQTSIYPAIPPSLCRAVCSSPTTRSRYRLLARLRRSRSPNSADPRESTGRNRHPIGFRRDQEHRHHPVFARRAGSARRGV